MAIALVVLAFGIVGCGSSAGALDVAEEWLAAYEAGDASAYQGAMDADATFDCINCGYSRATTTYFATGGGADQDLRDARLLAIAGGTLNPSCETVGDRVRCSTERTSAFGYFDAAGQPTQIDRSIYEFEFEGDRIVHLTVTRQGGNLFDVNKIQSYRSWVAENYPDAHGELFVLGTILIDSDELFTRHQELAMEYFSSP